MRKFAMGVVVGVAVVGVPVTVLWSRFVRDLGRATGWG